MKLFLTLSLLGLILSKPSLATFENTEQWDEMAEVNTKIGGPTPITEVGNVILEEMPSDLIKKIFFHLLKKGELFNQKAFLTSTTLSKRMNHILFSRNFLLRIDLSILVPDPEDKTFLNLVDRLGYIVVKDSIEKFNISGALLDLSLCMDFTLDHFNSLQQPKIIKIYEKEFSYFDNPREVLETEMNDSSYPPERRFLAQYNLAKMLDLGQAGERKVIKAWELFAALKNNEDAPLEIRSLSHFQLTFLKDLSHGENRNFVEAAKKLAILKDDPNLPVKERDFACFKLADLSVSGQGFPRNVPLAKTLYNRVKKNKILSKTIRSLCVLRLGNIAYSERNYAFARHIYTSLQRNKHLDAQKILPLYRLAEMAYFGLGGSKNLYKACKIYFLLKDNINLSSEAREVCRLRLQID